MTIPRTLRPLTLVLIQQLTAPASATEPPVAWWSFDSDQGPTATDRVSGAKDTIHGIFRFADGVQGKCIRMDGYTTDITRPADTVPQLTEALTIEAWIAPQTYPWNWTPILNQGGEIIPPKVDPPMAPAVERKQRIFFGLDAAGHLALKLEIDGKLQECVSTEPLPLLKWTHVAGSFDQEHGITLYLNGKPAGSLAVKGHVTPAGGGDLILGRNIQRMGAAGSERKPSADWRSDMVIDGLLDEVKLYDRALSADEVAGACAATQPAQPQPLQWQTMPAGPKNLPARFGAMYCRLRYDELWEERWRVSDQPDILVHFDTSPVRLIFWRGTGYGGAWVTENGRWMGDQSLERSGSGKSPLGCAEHMSDKQTRYSRVSIIENNDARIILYWRYALCDINYDIFGATSATDWGEWADEYYVIYPDAVSTRHQTLWTDHLSHEWQETIVLNQPGTRPEDNIDLNAMTFANMKGESKTYSWAEPPPASKRPFPEPADITIQMVNLKSQHKPFIVHEPGAVIKPFTGAIRSEVSHFPWWNHWPVAQLPNDGRLAFAPDRPSHSSLSQSNKKTSPSDDVKAIHKNNDGSYSVVTLIGMTDQPVTSLVLLARSWNHPPGLNFASEGFSGGSYDKCQRAFVLECKHTGQPQTLEFTIAASEGSPLLNPAFVIRNWGESEADLQIDGQPMPRGKDFRLGHEHHLEGSDLTVWIKTRATQPVKMTLRPANQ